MTYTDEYLEKISSRILMRGNFSSRSFIARFLRSTNPTYSKLKHPNRKGMA